MRIRTLISIAVLSGCMASAQAPSPSIPLDLTKEETLELENYSLKVRIIQMNAQKEYDLLTPQVQAYQAKVLGAHPGAKYRLDMGSLSWQPLPAPPPPTPATVPPPAPKPAVVPLPVDPKKAKKK